MIIKSTTAKVLAIRKGSKRKVYDLQTKNHNFVANNVVVHNCIIFQEDVMNLAHHVGGFPMDKCDEVRRAIMKRSISGGEEAKKKAKELEDSFVQGAVSKGLTEELAKKTYQAILYMAGYGFNKSHAVAYAIDSYYCAWLATYYSKYWLTAYLESMSSTPENREKAFGEIKALGYTIATIDVNKATDTWTLFPGKVFMPSLLSCKGVGQAIVDEILRNRPYNSIEHLLWDDNNEWKHSKFNKKALETLIKIKALDSLNCVGTDKMFKSYKHLWHVVIEHQDDIKKTSKRDPLMGRKAFYELVKQLECEEWSSKELAEFAVEIFGSLDVSSLLEPGMLNYLREKEIKSIDDIEENEQNICWFVVQDVTVKLTKAKKKYLLATVMGPKGKPYRLNVWVSNKEYTDPTTLMKQFDVFAAQVERNAFGCSTSQFKLKKIS